MGFCRMVDFSQFKVRGHYTHSARLGRYFRCLMWLGRIDIPVAGGPWERCPDVLRFASPRELGTAIVLWHLLNTSGQFDRWRDMEQTISGLVGTTDSLNFGQLAGLLAGAGIRTLADVRDMSTLERLQADLARGELGVQNIRSDWFQQPLAGPVRYALPQTFTVFGQNSCRTVGHFPRRSSAAFSGSRTARRTKCSVASPARSTWPSRCSAIIKSCPIWSHK